MTLFKARFSDSEYHVGTAFLVLTFSYVLFCFRINMHLWTPEHLSQCHGGRFLGKSLCVDYNTGLNINISEISGSCLGKKKNRQFYHSNIRLSTNMDKEGFSLSRYESSIGKYMKSLKIHRAEKGFLSPWRKTGKNPAQVFRNQADRHILLKAVSFSTPVTFNRSQAWSPKKLFFLMTTFLHSPGCPHSGKTLTVLYKITLLLQATLGTTLGSPFTWRKSESAWLHADRCGLRALRNGIQRPSHPYPLPLTLLSRTASSQHPHTQLLIDWNNRKNQNRPEI